MAITPAMVVVLTAPSPTRRMPSLPSAGAISKACFTLEIYHARSRSGATFDSRSMMTAMMFLLRMLMRRGRGPAMDPLHVSMTGVRMGERFLQIGCHDRALLSGLAAKVGLSGTAAVAAFDERTGQTRERRRREGRRADRDASNRRAGAALRQRSVRHGGGRRHQRRVWQDRRDHARRLLAGGPARSAEAADASKWLKARRRARPGYDALRDLTTAGFKPVRLLAEKDGLRFLEGLRTLVQAVRRRRRRIVRRFDDEPALDVTELDLVAVLEHASAP